MPYNDEGLLFLWQWGVEEEESPLPSVTGFMSGRCHVPTSSEGTGVTRHLRQALPITSLIEKDDVTSNTLLIHLLFISGSAKGY